MSWHCVSQVIQKHRVKFQCVNPTVRQKHYKLIVIYKTQPPALLDGNLLLFLIWIFEVSRHSDIFCYFVFWFFVYCLFVILAPRKFPFLFSPLLSLDVPKKVNNFLSLSTVSLTPNMWMTVCQGDAVHVS